MEQVRYTDFIKQIAIDYNLTLEKEFKLKLPADKKAIKSFVRSVAHKVRVFDGQNEYPYMDVLHSKRNEQALLSGIELRYVGEKALAEILKEADIKLITENCKISEGGGWYSNGTRYIYREIYCEI